MMHDLYRRWFRQSNTVIYYVMRTGSVCAVTTEPGLSSVHPDCHRRCEWSHKEGESVVMSKRRSQVTAPVESRRATRSGGGLAPMFVTSPTRKAGNVSDRASRIASRNEAQTKKLSTLNKDSTDDEFKEAILGQLPAAERAAHDKQLAEQTVYTLIDGGQSRVMVRPLLACKWDTKGTTAWTIPQCFHTKAVFSPAKMDRAEERHDWDDFSNEAIHSVFFRHLTIKMLTFTEHYFRTLSKAATEVHKVLTQMRESTTLSARDSNVIKLSTELVQAKGTFAHYVALGRTKIPKALFCSVPGTFTKGDAVGGNYDHYPEQGRYGHPVSLGASAEEYPMDNIDSFCDAINEKKMILCNDFGGDPSLLSPVPDDWEVVLWREQYPTAGDKRTHTNEDKETPALTAARDSYASDLAKCKKGFRQVVSIR